jgi:type II secretory ATPase GspE/PulE/Tfp pilus assembly ATPase PilB-like protein
MLGSFSAVSMLVEASHSEVFSAIVALALPFNPLRLVLLVAWVYLCMYCVQQVQFGPLVPEKYKPVANIVSLLAGPIVLLSLVIAETVKKSRSGQSRFFEVLKQQLQNALTGLRSIRTASIEEDSTFRLLDSSGRTMDEIYGHGQAKREDARILDQTESLVADAIERRASDILIDPKDESTYSIRLRIDGVLRNTREMSSLTCQAVINSIKAVAGMDISERRRPQDGAFLARHGERTASFRVASSGTVNGEKLSIRVLNREAAGYTLKDLGLSRKQKMIIKQALHMPSGMILICGPTGSGKTTTMYAMLPQTSQIEINPKADITFANTLRSVLRQDPNVICVGEIRDEETAEIALRAAQTGHLVLATLHCDSNATAIARLMDLGVSRLLLSLGLNLILSQRLLRCLCTRCRKPASLSDTQTAEFDRKSIDRSGIYEAGQCRQCDKTGYFGRTAICDILIVDESMKADIASGDSFAEHLRTEGSRKGRTNLRKEGLKRVVAGITSLEELKRVVG